MTDRHDADALTTADDLRLMCLDPEPLAFDFERLDTECLAGRPPSEWLRATMRALAKRARDKGNTGFRYKAGFYYTMADTLEAWADE